MKLGLALSITHGYREPSVTITDHFQNQISLFTECIDAERQLIFLKNRVSATIK